MNNQEENQICYPYAHGRLNASLDHLTNDLEMDCIRGDIEIDPKVIKLLSNRIKELQKVSIEESYDKH